MRPGQVLGLPREASSFPEALRVPHLWTLEPETLTQGASVSQGGTSLTVAGPQVDLCRWVETQGDIEAGRGEKC